MKGVAGNAIAENQLSRCLALYLFIKCQVLLYVNQRDTIRK